jgi:hypothetical protein
LVRIGVNGRRCFGFVRYGEEAGPCGGIEWVEQCDRCLKLAGAVFEERKHVEHVDSWAPRECAAADCDVVFMPATAQQRYHADRCRKRANRRLRAGLSANGQARP